MKSNIRNLLTRLSVELIIEQEVKYFSIMPGILKNHKELLVKKNILKIGLALGVLCIGIFSNYLGGAYLDKYYPNPVRPDDLVVDNVDQMDIFVKVGEVMGWIQLMWVTVSLTKQNFKDVPKYLILAGIFYIFRGITITLNPLATMQDPVANGSNPLFAELFYKGMFFSGHTGAAFLLFFLGWKNDNKRMRTVKFITASTVGVSVLLSHSHYSIDVVGGILAAYAVSNIKIPKWCEIKES